jgi:hypothetical protein
MVPDLLAARVLLLPVGFHLASGVISVLAVVSASLLVVVPSVCTLSVSLVRTSLIDRVGTSHGTQVLLPLRRTSHSLTSLVSRGLPLAQDFFVQLPSCIREGQEAPLVSDGRSLVTVDSLIVVVLRCHDFNSSLVVVL